MGGVPKGVSKQLPDKGELTEGELKKILKASKDELEDILQGDSDDDGGETSATPTPNTVDDEYDMDNYDNEPDNVADNICVDEDDEIRSDDNLILVGHVDDDVASIEVYVYNSEEGYLFVHHEIMLQNLPLCLEWLDYNADDTSKPANLVAVASTSPVIEIWDLDVIDSLKCKTKLGRRKNKKKNLT